MVSLYRLLGPERCTTQCSTRIRVDELHTHGASLPNPGDGGWVGLKMLTQKIGLRYVDRKWKKGREDVQNMACRIAVLGYFRYISALSLYVAEEPVTLARLPNERIRNICPKVE